MPTVKNISSEDLAIPYLGAVINAGESLDVDDSLLADRLWPAAVWQIDGSNTVTLVGDAYTAPVTESVPDTPPPFTPPPPPPSPDPVVPDVPESGE